MEFIFLADMLHKSNLTIFSHIYSFRTFAMPFIHFVVTVLSLEIRGHAACKSVTSRTVVGARLQG